MGIATELSPDWDKKVVTLPSIRDHKDHVWKDFQSVWSKLCFEQKMPSSTRLEEWLKENVREFHGNFRDLEKIAINWRQLHLCGLDSEKIMDEITENFKVFAYPKDNSDNIFVVDEEQDYNAEILPNFRNFIKNLAKKKYGKLKTAPNEKPFGVPHRTMERW